MVLFYVLGVYTAIFLVSNSVDAANISCNVQVVQILQQVYYAFDQLNWPFNNSSPFQASIYVFDINPGTVIFTWDFGDGTVVSGTRTGIKFRT